MAVSGMEAKRTTEPEQKESDPVGNALAACEERRDACCRVPADQDEDEPAAGRHAGHGKRER